MKIRNKLLISIISVFLVVLSGLAYFSYLCSHEALINLLNTRFIIIAMLGLLILFFTTLLLTDKISRPIGEMVAIANKISRGNTSLRFPENNSGDEMGQLSRAFNNMTGHLSKTLDELRREKGVLQIAFSQMSDGLVILHPNWNAIEFNETAKRLLMITSQKGILEHVLANFEPSVERPKLENAGKNIINFQLRRTASADAQELILNCKLIPILDSNYRLIERVLSVTDATAIEVENVAKHDFLSLMSHKLLTPITVLEGKLQLMNDGLLGPLPDELKPEITTMVRQSDKLKKLLNSLLHFITIESSHLELTKESIPIVQFMSEIVDQFEKRYSENGPHITVLVANDLQELEFNPKYLALIISELIENGLKFNTNIPAKITVEFTLIDNSNVITVSDNGIGIPPEFHQSIFDEFYQVEKHFTGNIEGVGLGLSYVKKIVESFGGQIEIDSTMQAGSRFTIRL